MKKGTRKYHVGVSPTGMNAVWRQGSQRPGSYQYFFSFRAYDMSEKGTVPFSVTYAKNDSSEDCFIVKLNSENEQIQSDFVFWVYPKQVYGSQPISLISKLNNSDSSVPSNKRKYSSMTSFWAPRLGNHFGNCDLLTVNCNFTIKIPKKHCNILLEVIIMK